MNSKRIVAVDVGKFWLDVAYEGTGRVQRLANTAAEVSRFVGRLDAACDLAVFERTGGYERLLEVSLAAAGVDWAVLHSQRVAAFRQAREIKAKTDALDAKVLRAYGRDRLDAGKLRLGRVADVVLHALLVRRRQLLATLHAERCRLDVAAVVVRPSIERVIAHLECELAAVEAEVAAHEASDPQHRRKQQILCEQIGVAEATARTLLGELPELGCLTAKEIAALGGLAPKVHKSGTIVRRRGVSPGRGAVKQALFYPALTAMRRDPDLAVFAQRLRDRGKPGMVIVQATMRKLLIRLNARLREALAGEATRLSASAAQ